MAEGLFNARGPLGWQAISAGIRPYGTATEGARWAMEQIGLDISHHRSRLVTDELVRTSDIVVVLERSIQLGISDSEEKRVFNWGVEDPYGGDRGEYARARDVIDSKVAGLIAMINEKG